MELKDIEELKIFEVIAGSQAYGTNTPESDIDIRGIFKMPKGYLESLGIINPMKPIERVGDKKNDIEFYELKRYFQLASDCNPNIIELLWMPEDCITKCDDTMKVLLNNRELFLTEKAYHTFSGYAHSQLERARGQNKWVNNPQPETAPSKTDFCWVIWLGDESMDYWRRGKVPDLLADDFGGFPCRPVSLKDRPEDLSNFVVAKLEHSDNMYRLYETDNARGVFRGEHQQLVVESIAKEEEFLDLRGFLIYNENEYKKKQKDWKHYWEWKDNRNEARYRTQESGEVDYDSKNLMHCIRIMMSGKSILEGNGPIVRFTGEPLQQLKDIRNGKYTYDELMDWADGLKSDLGILKERNILPHSIDQKAVDDLYRSLL